MHDSPLTTIELTSNSVCICSIIRATKLPSFTAATKNPTREFAEPIYWTAIEIYVATITPSLPAIRSLLSYHLPRIFPGHTATSPRSINLQNITPRPYFNRICSLEKPSAKTGTSSTCLATVQTQQDVAAVPVVESDTSEEWLGVREKRRSVAAVQTIEHNWLGDIEIALGLEGEWKGRRQAD